MPTGSQDYYCFSDQPARIICAGLLTALQLVDGDFSLDVRQVIIPDEQPLPVVIQSTMLLESQLQDIVQHQGMQHATFTCIGDIKTVENGTVIVGVNSFNIVAPGRYIADVPETLDMDGDM